MKLKKLNKEERAFLENLYKYEGMVLNIAYNHVGNYHDAEDITHDTYEKIAKYRHKIIGAPENEQIAYLIVVTRSCARDKYRKNRRESELFAHLDERITDSEDIDFLQIEASDSGLFAALRQLPKDSTDILLLRSFYGYEVREIADMLGLKESSTYQRLRKAKSELLELLNDPEIDKLGQKGKHKKKKEEQSESEDDKDPQPVTEDK